MSNVATGDEPMKVRKLTQILVVDSVEECLPFWTKLGFEVRAEVPHDNKIGFVILGNADTELMLQSHASVDADLPAIKGKYTNLLYAEVELLDEVERTQNKNTVLVPRRKTFYGAQEIWVQDPSGCVIGFSQHD